MKKKTTTKPKTLELRSLTLRMLLSADLEVSQRAMAGGAHTNTGTPEISNIGSGCGSH